MGFTSCYSFSAGRRGARRRMVRVKRSPGIEISGLAAAPRLRRFDDMVRWFVRSQGDLARRRFHAERWQAGTDRLLESARRVFDKAEGHGLSGAANSKNDRALAPEVSSTFGTGSKSKDPSAA
jgi:hypothetical protein